MQPAGAMEYRRLGRTGLSVSAVGFGTCQLRRVTKAQAIDTLLHGFELGVNLVHTAPDYEGAEDLVAAAAARTDRHVIVASQGYDIYYNSDGRVLHFERLFESTCRKLKTDRLDLFGIACVDDREAFRENVWGRGGMVEFLQRMKAKGRLGATFCTTHGNPEYIRKLIERGAFDAIMVAYNDLGFHLLSVNPPPGRHFEDIPRTGSEVFPLAARHDVGLMVMKPFAGGLLCPSKAFPPGDVAASNAAPPVAARDVLRSILSRPEVACVVPGTASVEEADENARAGHAPLAVAPAARAALSERVDALRASLCSRCGLCEPSCSQRLPIAMLFRAAYVALHPAESFETWEEVEYFRLQPRRESTCESCPDVSCACPAGIDIPKTLTTLNRRMADLLDRGGVAPPRPGPPQREIAWFAARLVTRDLPSELRPGRFHPCRLFIENTGIRPWHPPGTRHRSSVRLAVEVDGARVGVVNLREIVAHGRRCHFVFDLLAPAGCGPLRLCLRLVREHPWRAERTGLVLPHALELEVAGMLGEMIPCAQMTLFGKNGSDVCTAAARMARVFTGRPKILFSGYSGWQEPFAPAFEPALAQDGHAAGAIRFPANDLARARQLLEEHAGKVAAVFVEPAAQVEAVDGPVREADPEFLRGLAEACGSHGALLVFDEILTGFRHAEGSVQRATGVTPDLACFGKALTSGMPLSVLVGRREVMADAIRRIFYHPTFKGETYSFAAAAAALRIYMSEDIPGQVAAFGTRLKQAVAEAGRSAGTDGELIGPPYRMVYRFNEPDADRRALMRTLLKQELLKRGVMTFRGFMLPSATHGNLELEQTAEAFERALRRVRDVADAGDFERHLEIPPVI